MAPKYYVTHQPLHISCHKSPIARIVAPRPSPSPPSPLEPRSAPLAAPPSPPRPHAPGPTSDLPRSATGPPTSPSNTDPTRPYSPFLPPRRSVRRAPPRPPDVRSEADGGLGSRAGLFITSGGRGPSCVTAVEPHSLTASGSSSPLSRPGLPVPLRRCV